MTHIEGMMPSEQESHAALIEMDAFLHMEIERVMHLLTNDNQHHIDAERLKHIREELENPLTVAITSEPEFYIKRRGDNGFTFAWRDESEKIH